MRFPGQRYDAATGLYHNYFRDYDPAIGRYVQSDPIGLAGGISTYAYGNGAPLGFSDPLGLQGRGPGSGWGQRIGAMIARPLVERMGGGLLARAAGLAAKQGADMRRAQKLLERMQGIWGRIGRGGKRGTDEVPQGCRGFGPAHNAADAVKLTDNLRTAELANPLVDSLRTTGRLPANFVTKAEAMQAGWRPGKALNNSVSGGQLGGDRFRDPGAIGLPQATTRIWYEADIGLTNTMSRANQPGTRLLYSNDGLAFVTPDHYVRLYQLPNWTSP
jgi:RHS repeat-associated protein